MLGEQEVVGNPEKHITHIQVEIRVGAQQEKNQEDVGMGQDHSGTDTEAAGFQPWHPGNVWASMDSFVFLFYPKHLRASCPII